MNAKSTPINQLQSNSQMHVHSSDLQDDPNTVLDTLSQLNGGGNGGGSQGGNPMMEMTQQQQQIMHANTMPPMQNMEAFQDIMGAVSGSDDNVGMAIPPINTKERVMADLFSWNDDLKVAIIVMFVYVLVTLIPIENTIYKYVSLYKIPYSGVLIKAILAGVFVFIVKKLWR